MKYIFNINPKPKPRMTVADRACYRTVVINYWKYKAELQDIAKELNYAIPDILSDMQIIIKMPASWSQKKKILMDGKPHQQTPDLDNLIKAWQDIFADNDSSIHTYKNISKVWGLTGQIIIYD